MGGDCLNPGCVPSKALIAAAKAAQAMRRGAVRHRPGRAGGRLRRASRIMSPRVIATIAPVDSQERFEGLGVRRDPRLRAASPRQTEVEAGDTTIRARRFVIATGSRPFVPPIPGVDTVPYLTNETIFALRDKPAHLIVIGGGPIGMEMAQAHRRLGCEVTVIEGAKALGRDDPELAAVVLEALRAEGVRDHRRRQRSSRSRPRAGAVQVSRRARSLCRARIF